MSCQVFNKAVHYAKQAFTEALEKEELSDEKLSLLFHYYQGLKQLRDDLPKHSHDEEEAGPMFLSDSSDYTYPVTNGNLTFTPDVNMEDYITFNTDGTGGIGHYGEDDEQLH
tara:strand:+ start:98 stop:433 length:336 start_codon:yes stop_codon:yes gene_type:complete